MTDSRRPDDAAHGSAGDVANDVANERLPPGTADVLASWATSEPPAGFVDRVISATRSRRAERPAARRRWRRAALVASCAAAALGAAGVAALTVGGRAAQDGARITDARETIALGARGAAVAEAGSELTWTISASGAAEVHQTRGDVFYRVERGEPLEVETPYGRIVVRGACFRVEVLNMSMSRQAWLGGAVGAVLAATVVIAVYEGGVRVVNARGQADASAGQRIALAAGAAPRKLDGPAVAAVEPPPPGSATLAELLRRDQSHRGEIALLRERVRALESGAAPKADHRDSGGRRKIVDIPQDELAAMAKNCEIRFDVPGYGLDPRLMNDKLAAAAGLSADERAHYDQMVHDESERYMAALRALYRELGGGDAGDTLDAHSLALEIMQKSPAADVEAARKRLAEERAGLASPPADTRGASVVERLLRLQSSAGGALEQLLAAELGPDKAHQLRTSGWADGDDSILSGCPE